jgi:hypothetical protein
VKELLDEGNVMGKIANDDKINTLLDIPATVGVIGTVIIGWLATLGVMPALAVNSS